MVFSGTFPHYPLSALSKSAISAARVWGNGRLFCL
jgi:hypothetical protein